MPPVSSGCVCLSRGCAGCAATVILGPFRCNRRCSFESRIRTQPYAAGLTLPVDGHRHSGNAIPRVWGLDLGSLVADHVMDRDAADEERGDPSDTRRRCLRVDWMHLSGMNWKSLACTWVPFRCRIWTGFIAGLTGRSGDRLPRRHQDGDAAGDEPVQRRRMLEAMRSACSPPRLKGRLGLVQPPRSCPDGRLNTQLATAMLRSCRRLSRDAALPRWRAG